VYYVTHIYKYYIAYEIIEHGQAAMTQADAPGINRQRTDDFIAVERIRGGRMLAVDQGGSIAESAFHLFRFFVQCLIFLSAVAGIRWVVRTFLLNRGERSDRWRHTYFGATLTTVVVLLLLSRPAERLLTAVGHAISRLGPGSELAWLSGMLVGAYYTAIAISILILAIHILGLVYWFIDKRIASWQTTLRKSVKAGESNPRFQASRIVRVGVRLLRDLMVAALILGTFLFGFATFPATRILTDALRNLLGPPLQDAAQAAENYVPNLGYILVILVLAWGILKALKLMFTAIRDGTLVFDRFPPDWAEPTYKLCRTVLLLFALMVSFPYLPGAHSAFFRGFSVFVGALVTFGSSGAIGNLLAGIQLTYARAFKVGDVIQIEDVYGMVTEKTLLVTRVLAAGQEYVTIPNAKVLNNSVTNYSMHGLNKGVAVSVVATIGYDVDWRTVHKLMLEGAARTEQIATEPSPRVLEQSFGNYSVEYHLRAWTRTSEGIFETYAALRRNVLDTCADGGVEIMTPTILSHRDASELAVPVERFPNPPRPHGIRVAVDPQTDDSRVKGEPQIGSSP
jgi:small-conductance mechanosensitive channel